MDCVWIASGKRHDVILTVRSVLMGCSRGKRLTPAGGEWLIDRAVRMINEKAVEASK